MKRFIIGICTLGLLSACSSTAIKDTSLIEEAAKNIIESGQQNATEIVNQARELQLQAQQADLYFFSPKHMTQAEQEMAKAEQAVELQKSEEDIITYSLTAKTLYERGLNIKPIVESQLKPSLDAIAMLKALNAHILLKDDFADINQEVTNLIHKIEDGETAQASNDQIALLKDITELEIATLKAAYLSPAEIALEKAEDVDADDYASQTHDKAEQKVENLEQLIEHHYQNKEAIKTASIDAIRNAQHAQNIAIAAKPLLKLNNERAEQHVIYIESLLSRITTALQEDPLNHLLLNNQSIALAQKVETLHKQAQTNQNNPRWAIEKSELEDQIKQLNTTVKKQSEQLQLAKQEKLKAKKISEVLSISQDTKTQDNPAIQPAIQMSQPNDTALEAPTNTANGIPTTEDIANPGQAALQQVAPTQTTNNDDVSIENTPQEIPEPVTNEPANTEIAPEVNQTQAVEPKTEAPSNTAQEIVTPSVNTPTQEPEIEVEDTPEPESEEAAIEGSPAAETEETVTP